MSFTTKRNFRIPLRLIVFGVDSWESADPRLVVPPAISGLQGPIRVDDQSKLHV